MATSKGKRRKGSEGSTPAVATAVLKESLVDEPTSPEGVYTYLDVMMIIICVSSWVYYL